MADYAPPVRDIRFTLDTISDIDSVVALPSFDHVESDMIDGVLDEAARFFSEVFAPTNEVGDEIGSRFADGAVTTPDEFKVAWSKLLEAGWVSVTGSPDFGGHGFPKTIGLAISEMMTSANLAFSLCPML
ncbi:MAG: acyl-CoA dehydrogenase, partial [Acidimicrobiia bacterium]